MIAALAQPRAAGENNGLAEQPQWLVHVDASAGAQARLAYAGKLAQACGAGLTALYAPSGSGPGPFAYATGPGIAAVVRQLEDEQRLCARAEFESTLGATAQWAAVAGVDSHAAFVQQALFADLLVLGQPDPMGISHQMEARFALGAMLDSGTPAILLPEGWPNELLPGTVMVAWKPCRQAIRALGAALPLLRRAERVHVVGWPGEQHRVDGAMLDLTGYLKRHGVSAHWHLHATEPADVGKALLEQAHRLGADLMVMGCYGHGRLRERLLGGTTLTVLTDMTLPVLMAN